MGCVTVTLHCQLVLNVDNTIWAVVPDSIKTKRKKKKWGKQKWKRQKLKLFYLILAEFIITMLNKFEHLKKHRIRQALLFFRKARKNFKKHQKAFKNKT